MSEATQEGSLLENGGWKNFEMIEIEKYPCNDKNECSARERYWKELFKASLNIRTPSRTQKEYQEDNADIIKENRKEYYIKNKDEIINKTKEYRLLNKDIIKERKKQYRKDNIEALNKQQKEYYNKNKEQILQRTKEYTELNREKISQKHKKRYALKKANTTTEANI